METKDSLMHGLMSMHVNCHTNINVTPDGRTDNTWWHYPRMQ